MKKNWLIILSVSFALVSCAIAPPDVPVFYEIENGRAIYQYTISEKSGEVNNSDKPFFDDKFMKEPVLWSELKKTSVLLPSFSYSEINKYISKKEIKK